MSPKDNIQFKFKTIDAERLIQLVHTKLLQSKSYNAFVARYCKCIVKVKEVKTNFTPNRNLISGFPIQTNIALPGLIYYKIRNHTRWKRRNIKAIPPQ